MRRPFLLLVLLAVVGLALGVPLGVLVGRNGWRWVADTVPFIYVGPWAGLALVLVAPLAVVVANLVAAWPARRASTLHPAEILRAE